MQYLCYGSLGFLSGCLGFLDAGLELGLLLLEEVKLTLLCRDDTFEFLWEGIETMYMKGAYLDLDKLLH